MQRQRLGGEKFKDLHKSGAMKEEKHFETPEIWSTTFFFLAFEMA